MTVTTQGQPFSMARLFLVIVAANIVSTSVLAASVVLYLDAQRHQATQFESVTAGYVAHGA